MKFKALCFIALLNIFLTGCKDDSEDTVTRNAKGVVFDLWVGSEPEIDVYDISLWINNENIVWSMAGNDYDVVWSAINEKEYIPYHTFSMRKVYDLINDIYELNISPSTPQNEIPHYIRILLDEVKNRGTGYQYIANYYGNILLFRRIASGNYN